MELNYLFEAKTDKQDDAKDSLKERIYKEILLYKHFGNTQIFLWTHPLYTKCSIEKTVVHKFSYKKTVILK